MTALQQIIKEAKHLKKKYPKRFANWREYVAEASAIYATKHKGKSPVGKKHKKISGTKIKTMATKKTHKRKKIGAPTENAILKAIEKTKHEIAELEKMQKSHIGKKHIGSIKTTIRKKHRTLGSLIKKY